MIEITNCTPGTGWKISPEIFKFSAGEVQVKFNENSLRDTECKITTNIRSSDDLVSLWQVGEMLKRNNVKIKELYIPYLPCSRMDRVIQNYSFSLKFVSEIINSLNSQAVYTLDCHSEIPLLLINNLVNQDPYMYHLKFLKKIPEECRIFAIPDIGAFKRYGRTKSSFNWQEIIQCGKVRDNEGKIIKSKIYDELNYHYPIIIFDDICDGGATFVELAKELKAKGAGKLFLFVTHGIFSNGITELLKYYEIIGCTDSFGPYEFANEYLNNFKVISL
jgi:ribose-phosphate pyrophosphokinase